MVAYCGDDAAEKRTCIPLLDGASFEPVDVGPLHVARYLEPFGLLVARLAYAEGANPALRYHFFVPGAPREAAAGR
jgi:predicted dinucleotide-binding enzyme